MSRIIRNSAILLLIFIGISIRCEAAAGIDPASFTQKTLEAINSASNFAVKQGNIQLYPLHLAYTLYSDPSGLAARIVEKTKGNRRSIELNLKLKVNNLVKSLYSEIYCIDFGVYVDRKLYLLQYVSVVMFGHSFPTYQSIGYSMVEKLKMAIIRSTD